MVKRRTVGGDTMFRREYKHAMYTSSFVVNNTKLQNGGRLQNVLKSLLMELTHPSRVGSIVLADESGHIEGRREFGNVSPSQQGMLRREFRAAGLIL